MSGLKDADVTFIFKSQTYLKIPPCRVNRPNKLYLATVTTILLTHFLKGSVTPRPNRRCHSPLRWWVFRWTLGRAAGTKHAAKHCTSQAAAGWRLAPAEWLTFTSLHTTTLSPASPHTKCRLMNHTNSVFPLTRAGKQWDYTAGAALETLSQSQDETQVGALGTGGLGLGWGVYCAKYVRNSQGPKHFIFRPFLATSFVLRI